MENNINWFPGHMNKAIKQIKEKSKFIDLFIQVLDARAPFSSLNPIIVNEIIKNKPKILIINKVDLADPKITNQWKKYFNSKKVPFLLLNAKKNTVKNKIVAKINELSKKKVLKYQSKGVFLYKIKVLILGIPNVGKSTIINSLLFKKVVKVSNKPGVTKGQQWIKLSKNIDLLDSPGILWPKINNDNVAINLSLINAIKSDVLIKEDIIFKGFCYIFKNYFNKLISFYNLENFKFNFNKNLELINLFQKFLKSIKEIKKIKDDNQITELLFNDFINNKICRMSWEKPKI